MAVELKPLLINTHYNSTGASTAVVRLFDGLHRLGVPARILGYYGNPTRSFVADPYDSSFLRKIWLNLVMRYAHRDGIAHYEKTGTVFNHNLLPSPIHKYLNQISVDVLHFHWIGANFIPIQTFPRLNKPLVWTLHDMWAFTGGCHYDNNCERYLEHCGKCPVLGSNNNFDISARVLSAKKKYWKNVDITIVSPSNWMKSLVSNSPVLGDKDIRIIPNGIDTNVYQVLDKQFSRGSLGLPKDGKLILAGAGDIDNPSKGFALLIDAIQKMTLNKDFSLAIFGSGKRTTFHDFPIPVHDMGYVSNERLMTLLYSAADVFVAPSKQDNLPNTVMEALSCGTPSVAFDVTGFPDLIKHEYNGYLAKPFDTDSLAKGIDWVLYHPYPENLSISARNLVEQEFETRKIAKRYLDLYIEIQSKQAGFLDE